MRVTARSPVFILQIIFASVIISHTNSQSATITLSLCNSASDCTECMAANPLCNWCITKSTSGWSGTKRCDTYSNLIQKSCLPNDIKNITTEVTPIREDAVRDATDEGLPAIQVSPQNIKIKLRPNEKVKVPLTFRLAKDYPVDLYYLMDLSQSMADDKKKVADLGINLANEMRKITKDVRLGFGSFVDKVLMPYVNTLESRLESPCSNCESPYSYKHRLDLTQNTAIFGDRVNGTQVSGNLDGPEGGFDALMQAIVCGEVIGWRSNSRKMLIFSTDASFHSAGDGKLGGVVEPNDGLCHMSNGEYVYGTKQDYPSISQIASKVADYRVNVIFAVTKDQTGRYENLRELIPGSVTGTLANDSSNIVGLVRENYEKISSKVVMTIKRDNRRDDLKVKVRADCTNSGSFSDTAECDKLSPGDQAKFEVELQATSCDNINGVVEETFEVYPTGLAESLQITAQIDCSCTCDDAEMNSPACSGVGTYRCAVCECDATSYGDLCQCDVSNAGSDTTDLNAPCVRPSNSSQPQQPCSGRGECVCGVCETCDCLPGQSSDKQTCRRFTGHYCQCNPDNCPRNSLGICSGRGSCTCDQDTAVHTCQCDEGYSGTECECQISQETCKDPSNTEDPDLLCNGQGECICGKCKCYVPQDGNSERFTGRYCEECSGCPSKCQPFKQCVQCKVYEEKGWNEGSYDADYCAQSCGNGSNIEFVFVPETPSTSGPEIRQCSPYTSVDDCQVFYAYRYLPNRGGYTVYIKDEKESDEFCTKQNIEECLQYLDKEFQVLGLQSLYNGNGNFDVYRLVNVTQKLLRKCQHSSRYREELETRIHRCSADLEHSQNTQRKMRQTNKNLQNSIGKCEEVERQVRIENSSLQIKLKSQYDEVKRLKSLIQSNENQYRHETKKQERQLQLMKERAQQVMTDRSRQVPSIEISQCLSQRDGKRSRWRNESSSNRHEEDMYNTVMGNFEKRCTVLQSENRRLRDVLADIQIEMYELSNSAIPGGTSPRKTHSPRANKDLVQLPVDMIQQRLIESLRNTSERIRTKIDNNNEPNDMNVTFTLEPHPQTIEEKELSPQYKTQEVDKSIDVSLLEEQENLSKEKTQFYKQKVKLEQEKQNLAEAVLNLQKERLKFEEMRVESMSSPVNGANNKQSPRNHLTVSPKNHSTVSPRNHSTASPRNHSTASPRNNSTLSPGPKSGLSTYRSPGRCNDDRISEHMEQVKLAVQDRERDGKSPH